MSDAYTLGFVLGWIAGFICHAILKIPHRSPAKQSHRNRPDSDRAIYGDVVRIPDDLKIRNHAERNRL